MAEPHRPTPPSDVQINGKDETADYATKWMSGDLTISAVMFDNLKHDVRLRAIVEEIDDKAGVMQIGKAHYSPYVATGKRGKVTIRNLRVNTRYRVYLTTYDRLGKHSKLRVPAGANPLGTTTITFWTNRRPVVEAVAPQDNQQFPVDQPILLDWTFTDPDGAPPSDPHNVQYEYKVRWRYSADRYGPAGTWEPAQDGFHKATPPPHVPATTSHTLVANKLKANRWYEWQVSVRDKEGLWSDWSVTRDFYVSGVSSPPRTPGLLGPVSNAVLDVTQPITLSWFFKAPATTAPGDYQVKADIQWRPAVTAKYSQATSPWANGTSHPANDGEVWIDTDTNDAFRWTESMKSWVLIPWIVKIGNTTTPGGQPSWTLPPNTFQPGVQYEWQVRTYSHAAGGATPSDWCYSEKFWTIKTPGWALEPTVSVIEEAPIQGSLGCGHHRVFAYRQGGIIPVGEITPIQQVQWSRRRDDIGSALIQTNGFGVDCGQMLAELHTWMHELVVYRDDDRVFEGPITRIADHTTHLEIEAKDVLGYVYRRIMRQGYNDTYREILVGTPPTKVKLGQATVVDRAASIIINALGYKDPNVLPYLTVLRNSGDAKQSRIVPDYSRSAWEEVDDLAANVGLDYTTVGRRIILWDTHRSIGVLPEMRGDDFSSPPVITEYGMQLANYLAVTNNNGVWGSAYPIAHDADDWDEIYGPVEMLSSSYSESEAAVTNPSSNKARQEMVTKFESQANRGIDHRWPAPQIVRVPDNSTLSPEVNVGIQQLVPGVWIPLRYTGAVRSVAQWQKLDIVTVTETDAGETVQVVMSPAPNGGEDDPDAAAAAEAS